MMNRRIYFVILNRAFCQKGTGFLEVVILILIVIGLYDNNMSLYVTLWRCLPFKTSTRCILLFDIDSYNILIIILRNRNMINMK